MYTISRDPDGVVLLCHQCTHVERIDAFNKNAQQSPHAGSTGDAESLTGQARRRFGSHRYSEDPRSDHSALNHEGLAQRSGVKGA
jgi:hypothetical protein